MLVARLQEAFDAEKPAEEEAPTTAAAGEEKMETEAVAAEETAKAETMEMGEAAAKTEETPAEGKPAENKTEAKVEEKGCCGHPHLEAPACPATQPEHFFLFFLCSSFQPAPGSDCREL